MAMVEFSVVVSFLVSLCLVNHLTQATTVHYCDKKANYDVKVSGVEISPNPVVKGKPATFSVSASAGETITGGQLVIDVSYFGVHIYSESHDLCGKTSCPISTGDFVISHSQELPGFTPPGTYTLVMTMEDRNNHLLTCITFDFSIGFVASQHLISVLGLSHPRL